MSQSSLLGVC